LSSVTSSSTEEILAIKGYESSPFLQATSTPFLLRATSIGLEAQKIIPNQGRVGRIQGVFKDSLNIILPNDRVMSIVRSDIGRGPMSIVTNLQPAVSMLSIGVSIGDDVYRVGGSFAIGRDILTVSTDGAEKYEPTTGFETPLRFEDIKKNLVTMKELALTSGRNGGLGELIEFIDRDTIDCYDDRKLNIFARYALPRITELVDEIKNGRVRRIGKVAKTLIGLGPGLTPSADDFLSGLMISRILFASSLHLKKGAIFNVNREIIKIVRGRTTPLSQEDLLQAAEGKGSELITMLVEKLFTGDLRDVSSATMRVIAIGETSGTDIILGILLGAWLSLDEVYQKADG